MSPTRKSRTRSGSPAEKEEKLNYEQRFTEEWLDDLEPLGTDWRKPFLQDAPALIVVFRQDYAFQGARKVKHYYVAESVGIAVGFLLAAIHNAGLVALTHTPSPMGFLREILARPENEKPFLLIPVGYPKQGAMVPDIHRKTLATTELLIFVEAGVPARHAVCRLDCRGSDETTH